MRGRVIDKNLTEAYVTFEDGNTVDVSLSYLPRDTKVGDTVEVQLNNHSLTNDKLVDFF
jgi:hypothetical protein